MGAALFRLLNLVFSKLILKQFLNFLFGGLEYKIHNKKIET